MFNICSFNTIDVYLKIKQGILEILLAYDKISIITDRFWILIILREY